MAELRRRLSLFSLVMDYMGTAARVNWMLARRRLLPSPYAMVELGGPQP
ncbi:MAG: hypothetical protein RLZZ158_1136 [Cyanobacteriota bacterium]|jgi:amino acid transporter